MIPDSIVEAIHGAAIISVGARDEQLRSTHTFVIGAVVHPDRETITCFVPEQRFERIINNFKNNGRIALAVSLLTHEAYQLKGAYIDSRPADAKDRAVQELHRAKLLSAMLQLGYPEAIVRPFILGFLYQPSVAFSFRVEEIFLQTPGPEAGKKLN
ncbi:MAG: hypothetical protein HYZ50_25940 [Deltaproteobacteria bacterium]|nr:hypothetical protein [Deltaproteobacteria bacterium]